MRSLRGVGLAVKRLLVTLASLALALVMRGERPSRACSGIDYDLPVTGPTFDHAIVGDWPGLGWVPGDATYGGSCDDCLAKAIDTAWTGYLTNVVAADWKKILYEAPERDLAALAKGRAAAPRGYATSSVWKVDPAKLGAAIQYVRYVRRLEPHLTLDAGYGQPGTPPTEAMVREARDQIGKVDPFLAQRYAYQAIRAAFYRSDWPLVVSLHDGNPTVLAGPSIDLAWRARHYLAGALMRSGKRGRANLELARIAIDYQPLAGRAVFEFAPKDDADWREALRLARSTKDKLALWRVLGIRKDGLIGAREVLALDPTSPHAALLIVRELTKLEEQRVELRLDSPDAADLAAERRAFDVIEKLALDLIQKRGDRPWLMELIAGHIAALRGDVATARPRLARALAAQPNNDRVRSQVNASLAIAISHHWKAGDPRLEAELAANLAQVVGFGRSAEVSGEIRQRLAPLYHRAGQPAIAELLVKGTVEQLDPPARPSRWRDLAFIKELMARETAPKTPFERFVASDTYTRDQLQLEIAMRLLFDGDFPGALAAYDNKHSQRLSQDPFGLRIKDCFDCDRASYRGTLTYTGVLRRLVELDAKVKAGGEAGADAALQIGMAMFNLTNWGNSKWMNDGSHAGDAGDAALALRYFKTAHDLTANRELKTKAALFAAKAEMIQRIADPAPATPDPDEASPPLPKTWYPILKRYRGTRYYKEVIKECGRFASWAAVN